MNEDLEYIQFSPIRNYNYAQWFQDVQHNGRVLTGRNQQDYIAVLNNTIDQYSEGLPLLRDALKEHKDQPGEKHRFLETIWLTAKSPCEVGCLSEDGADSVHEECQVRYTS